MSGWDEGGVFSSNASVGENQARLSDQAMFKAFIQQFRASGAGSYIYRDKLIENVHKKDCTLDVTLEDLRSYKADLETKLTTSPAFFLPLFEQAAKEVLAEARNLDSVDDVEDIQITLSSSANPGSVRSISSTSIAKIIHIAGIVIAASKTRVKAVTLTLTCRNCGHTTQESVRPGFGAAHIPRRCRSSTELREGEGCGMDSYVINPDKSTYVDQQILKLQEFSTEVPTGEMPRTMQLCVDRKLVSLVAPGTRVTAIGINSLSKAGGSKRDRARQTAAVGINTPYIRVVGLQVHAEGSRDYDAFTNEEERQFRQLAARPDIYEAFASSIAPSIFGFEDIKKAVACLLVGGSRSFLPDGLRLRGDINVLLMGDPSTAKSQLLKCVEKVAPICVYTSGKGSSAAGLTAAVVKDPSNGEWYLEGGAMVLADGGVVCIDEFDKMREDDRVAIHEAMEQQTISIAKAGITTILNSRTSVLAAANPIFGSFDDLKTAAENIDLQSTILSRFDLIFLVKDLREAERDKMIAGHVLNLHGNLAGAADPVEGEIDTKTLRRFIAYIKSRIAPRLSEQASKVLLGHYVSFRQAHKEKTLSQKSRPVIPITVRQLEAIIRVSEALAKFSLSPEVTQAHVNEAYRLFTVSTLDADNAGLSESLSEETQEQIARVEEYVRKRMVPGTVMYAERLTQEMRGAQIACDARSIHWALHALCARGEFELRNQGNIIKRKM